ncbi:MAG: hypothetical protein KGS45_06030 [Planctomycetes bacterium]|nr:hypothetical protein [Planctomycetota bacterium]
MSTDSVRIMCPNLACRRILSVPGAARGKTVRCRNCSTNIKVPAVSAKAPDGTAAQPPKA